MKTSRSLMTVSGVRGLCPPPVNAHSRSETRSTIPELSAVPALKVRQQPGPRVRPPRVGRPRRDAEYLRRFLDRQPREVAEPDQLRRLRVGLREPAQRVVERNEVLGNL